MTDKAAHPVYDHKRLFLIGVLALFTAALSAALRAGAAADIKAEYLDAIDIVRSGQLIAEALGVSFLGFAIVLFTVSPILDLLGMGRVLRASSLFFIIGNLLVVFSSWLAEGEAVYWLIWLGMLLNGLAWGAVEATINPMTTSLYREDKTSRMNILHAWWPAGLIVGGLLSVVAGIFGFAWQVSICAIVIPAAIFGLLTFGVKFPQTERADKGISAGEMFREIFRRPSFFIWFGAMFLTAATELAPGQWVDLALTRTVGMRGILLLVYVSGLMFVMRHFAGPLAHRLSDVGLLWLSCLLAAVGLYMLSIADSMVSGLVAATVWGAGVAFLWPTMVAAVAERYTRGGSWMIGLMGSAGALSIYFVLPELGKIYDSARLAAAGGEAGLAGLEGAALMQVDAFAAAQAFQAVAVLPVILLLVFGLVWLRERRKGVPFMNEIGAE